MKALSYERLSQIALSQKPYRGTTNRYPVGDRRHNTKNFYVEEMDGQKIYRITYGHRWKEHFCTEDDYKADPKNVHYREYADEGEKYVRYEVIPNTLGIVRPDNTFEFTSEHGYGQGSNSIISSWSSGWFFSSSRHGGMVYRSGDTFHPIFKGMRVYCDTMQVHESSKYRVVGKRVNRKEGSKFLKRYEDFYKVNEVMLKVTDWKQFMETAVDVLNDNKIDTEHWYIRPDAKRQLLEFADRSINDTPLDSCVAFAIAFDINSMWSRARAYANDDKSSYYRREQDLEQLFGNIKRKLNKELYKANPSVMKRIEHEMGKYYPPSEWGVDIYVGDREVEQY